MPWPAPDDKIRLDDLCLIRTSVSDLSINLFLVESDRLNGLKDFVLLPLPQ